MLTIENIQNKNVLLRADLDLPLKEGKVDNDYRLRSLLPTLKFCLQHARKTIIIGHLGRPAGEDPHFSLAPVAESLKRLLNQDIPLLVSGISPGERWGGESPLVLQENLRFDFREEKIDRGFAQELAEGADIYIYESFANYRNSTSLTLIPEVLPTFTGFRFDQEVATLKNVLSNPLHPTLLIASGAKQDKLEIINKITPQFDQTLLGGVLAPRTDRTPDGLDLTPETTSRFVGEIAKAKTIVLNGPLGAYEDGTHSQSTKVILQAIIDSGAFSVIGGGDTLAAIPFLGFSYASFSFVSTGGGAMLDFLAQGTHPLLEVLKNVKLN
ncbi:MAG TPA: phosphoglycerate kinase [Candidatus Woesebacteria bacterium]|nr:phosphoglycerate kinase [Candidatus Woesebacteria bacterium]